MKKFMQKIDSFAKRFVSEISEADVVPECDLDNLNSASSESINDSMLEELKKAQSDTMSLFSNSVDPNYKTKKGAHITKQGNLEQRAKVDYELEKNEDTKQINGKELDR